jgi:hypothetical protein
MTNELAKIEELKQRHKASFHHGHATAYAIGAEAIAYAECLERELLATRDDEAQRGLDGVLYWAKHIKLQTEIDELKEKMIIKKEMLRTDLPEVREKNGHVNCVLALVKPEYYSDSNTYLPAWHVSNTVYYNKNSHHYQGWIELEEVDFGKD